MIETLNLSLHKDYVSLLCMIFYYTSRLHHQVDGVTCIHFSAFIWDALGHLNFIMPGSVFSYHLISERKTIWTKLGMNLARQLSWRARYPLCHHLLGIALYDN